MSKVKRKKRMFKFSVIIPIYNVEEYLEQTILSIVNQSIGFERNIQIILVNDGSTDNSEEICLKYQVLYPNNIIYIYQKNAGVSSARNKGLKYAEGEFVNFLDGDDKWGTNSFEQIYTKYQENKEISLFSCRMMFFDAKRGNHPLNYKYKEEKIVDILTDWEYPQLSSSSIFIKKDIIKDHKFEKNIKYSEDNKFINEIILEQQKFMVMKEPFYFYRKRNNETSAIQNQINNPDYYTVTPIKVYKHLIDLSQKKYGKVINYIQNLIMYDIQWRIKAIIPKHLDEKIIEEYKENMYNLLTHIDDEIIMKQKNIYTEYRLKLINIKHQKDIRKDFVAKNNKLYYKDTFAMDICNETRLQLRTIHYNKDSIRIIGLFNIFLPLEDFELYYTIGKERNKINLEQSIINEKRIFGEKFKTDYGFDITIPNNFKKMSFEVKYKNGKPMPLHINFKMNTGLNNFIKTYVINSNKIYYVYENCIKIKENTKKNRLKMRLRYAKQLFLLKKVKILITRIIYYIYKKFKKNEIWLISDRTPVANDNGFAFFKYLNSLNLNNINSYFVINKDSTDLKKVKKTGKHIFYNSFKYKLYFLLADKIISSQADIWTTNAYGNDERYYRDLYDYKFVFLQHGIIKDDLSAWLNKYDKKINIFVTSAINEYKSIINTEAYGFGKNVVKLTGLPRYDLLNNDKKEKLILFMPTWRKSLAKALDEKTGVRKENSSFKESEYYLFYNSLINDKRLLNVMEEKGYRGLFISHPALSSNSNDFDSNEIIKNCIGMVSYTELFNFGSLLVSDFSSVPFDFGYLNKPVMFTQFDKDTFFEQHSYDEGYFNYERDAFGPVLYNYEDTINEIIKFIENDCNLEKKYQERINNFYAYHDKNNCKRVLEEILKLK